MGLRGQCVLATSGWELRINLLYNQVTRSSSEAKDSHQGTISQVDLQETIP